VSYLICCRIRGEWRRTRGFLVEFGGEWRRRRCSTSCGVEFGVNGEGAGVIPPLLVEFGVNGEGRGVVSRPGVESGGATVVASVVPHSCSCSRCRQLRPRWCSQLQLQPSLPVSFSFRCRQRRPCHSCSCSRCRQRRRCWRSQLQLQPLLPASCCCRKWTYDGPGPDLGRLTSLYLLCVWRHVYG
jgi:hypothetical protein